MRRRQRPTRDVVLTLDIIVSVAKKPGLSRMIKLPSWVCAFRCAKAASRLMPRQHQGATFAALSTRWRGFRWSYEEAEEGAPVVLRRGRPAPSQPASLASCCRRHVVRVSRAAERKRRSMTVQPMGEGNGNKIKARGKRRTLVLGLPIAMLTVMRSAQLPWFAAEADFDRGRLASKSGGGWVWLRNGMGEACGVACREGKGVTRGVDHGVVRGVLRGVRPLGGGCVRDCARPGPGRGGGRGEVG